MKRYCDVSNTTNVQGLRSFQNWGSQKYLQNNANFFFWIFLFNTKKIPLVSLLENIPHFHYFPNAGRGMSIYNFLLLRPCTLVVLQRSQKRFGFLINFINPFLNYGWRRKFVMTLPHLNYILITGNKLKMMNWKIQVFERLLQKEHVRSHKFCSSLTVWLLFSQRKK